MPEPITPRPADDEAAFAIRGLRDVGRYFFDKAPFGPDDIEELPELAKAFADMERLAGPYRQVLLRKLGTDDAPTPIVHEGRVYSREAGRVVVTSAGQAPGAGPAAG